MTSDSILYSLDSNRVRRLREEFLKDQEGRCAVCLTPLISATAVLDHDHRTGIIRAALCTACNLRVGHVERGTRDATPAEREYLQLHGSEIPARRRVRCPIPYPSLPLGYRWHPDGYLYNIRTALPDDHPMRYSPMPGREAALLRRMGLDRYLRANDRADLYGAMPGGSDELAQVPPDTPPPLVLAHGRTRRRRFGVTW